MAKIHSEILEKQPIPDWYAAYPQRFQNKHVITPRRWLGLCDPELTELITSRLGPGFLTNLDRLEELGAADRRSELIREFNRIKREKKVQLAAVIEKNEGVVINPDAGSSRRAGQAAARIQAAAAERPGDAGPPISA